MLYAMAMGIINDMPLDIRVTVANLEEDDVPSSQSEINSNDYKRHDNAIYSGQVLTWHLLNLHTQYSFYCQLDNSPL